MCWQALDIRARMQVQWQGYEWWIPWPWPGPRHPVWSWWVQGQGAGVLPERASSFMVTTWWASVGRKMGRGLDGTPTFRVQTPSLVSRGSSFAEGMG